MVINLCFFDVHEIIYELAIVTISIVGIIIAYMKLSAIQKSISLSKIDTLVKLEIELNKLATSSANIHRKYNKKKITADIRKETDVEDHAYFNCLNNVCFFLLNSGEAFIKKYKKKYKPWISIEMKKDSSIRIIYDKESPCSHIQEIYKLWK